MTRSRPVIPANRAAIYLPLAASGNRSAHPDNRGRLRLLLMHRYSWMASGGGERRVACSRMRLALLIFTMGLSIIRMPKQEHYARYETRSLAS